MIPPFQSMFSIVLTALIPIIAAVVGYGTNVAALKMTFYPLQYIGIRLCGRELPGILGWQVSTALPVNCCYSAERGAFLALHSRFAMKHIRLWSSTTL